MLHVFLLFSVRNINSCYFFESTIFTDPTNFASMWLRHHLMLAPVRLHSQRDDHNSGDESDEAIRDLDPDSSDDGDEPCASYMPPPMKRRKC